jgi:aspartyl aminopeptidase
MRVDENIMSESSSKENNELMSNFNQQLIAFLQASPTPFHATQTMAQQLSDAGFQALDEADQWQLEKGKSYYVIRNGSSLVAFTYGKQSPLENGFRIVGAHTDSPCLKVKPNPELIRKGYFQLGVEVYGGALLNPWFDRDLSLAGKVVYKNSQGEIKSTLLDFKKPIASIPSLAIHLDREANQNRSINPQKDIPPLLMQTTADKGDFRQLLLSYLNRCDDTLDVAVVMDYELSFYDCQPPALVGFNEEFLASARLDNLLSCFVGMKALIDTAEQAQETVVLVCNDHEEVGSVSAVGAQGPMLKSILRRLSGGESELVRALGCSMLISADNAHGLHPNFMDKHDENHGPKLNSGPVIKINANQRYATDSETSSLLRDIAQTVGEPVQSFVVRTDMGCGSTIGPITASELGIKTLDIGVPTFAMHSIREMAGSEDAFSLYRILLAFNQRAKVSID